MTKLRMAVVVGGVAEWRFVKCEFNGQAFCSVLIYPYCVNWMIGGISLYITNFHFFIFLSVFFLAPPSLIDT